MLIDTFYQIRLNHEKTQVISTVSMVSRGDFCFAVEAGVIICRLRFQSLSRSLVVGIWKVLLFPVTAKRDVQPRPRELIVNLRSLRSKMAPRKGFYVFARCLNLDLTSKNSLCAKRTCLHHKPDTDGFFFLKKRAMVFQKKLCE